MFQAWLTEILLGSHDAKKPEDPKLSVRRVESYMPDNVAAKILYSVAQRDKKDLVDSLVNTVKGEK